MKKLFIFLTSLSIPFLSAMPMKSFAYDYDYCFDDFLDENNYSVHKEYKTGTFYDENSRFNGCDLYTLETVEAYEGLPTLNVEYDYLVVSDSIIGNWFEKRKAGDSRFDHQYDIKLPLHTGYTLDENFLELQDTHSYDLYIMWKRVPYISITADTRTEPLLDSDKLAEMFPDAEMDYISRNENGDYIYYLSTGDISTNFNEYECDVETVLTYEDAQKICELGNEHILGFSYCSAYEMQKVSLPEYPVYNAEYVEKAAAVFEDHGFNVTIEQQQIVPDEPVPALEYFEIITDIQEKENVMPNMTMFESNVQTISNSTELLCCEKGDINCDGSVGIADIVTLERYLLGRETSVSNADINNDGSVDVYDIVLMRQMLINNRMY